MDMGEHLFRQIYPHPVKRLTLALINGPFKGLTIQERLYKNRVFFSSIKFLACNRVWRWNMNIE